MNYVSFSDCLIQLITVLISYKTAPSIILNFFFSTTKRLSYLLYLFFSFFFACTSPGLSGLAFYFLAAPVPFFNSSASFHDMQSFLCAIERLLQKEETTYPVTPIKAQKKTLSFSIFPFEIDVHEFYTIDSFNTSRPLPPKKKKSKIILPFFPKDKVKFRWFFFI